MAGPSSGADYSFMDSRNGSDALTESNAVRETTVRGQFARSVSGIEDPDLRRRVLLTGLRALEGRRDLEVA